MTRAFSALLILFFIFPFSAFSQGLGTGDPKGSFNIGVEGGIQFTNIGNTASSYESKSRNGFNVGAFGEYYVSSSFKIRTGFYYDNRGFNLFSNTAILVSDTTDEIKSYLYYYDVDYTVNYLTIPIGVAFEKGSEKFRIVIQVNFYYSLLLNAKMEGLEAYYFEPSQGIDLSGTILNQGLNEFNLSGSTEGIARTNIARDRTSENLIQTFNTNDLGFNILVGVVYNFTPQVGIFANFGFTYSMGRLFEDPNFDSKWSQITRINLGFNYNIPRR